MIGACERADELETENGEALRELAMALSVEGDEPDPRLVTDGGRPGDPAAEAEAIAGPEGEAAEEIAKAKREAKRWTPPAGYEERGDGQQTAASKYFGGVRR